MADARSPCAILSPLGTAFEGQATQATLPTPDGEITILAHHMPIVAVLSDGEVRIPTEKGEVVIAVAGGFLDTDLDARHSALGFRRGGRQHRGCARGGRPQAAPRSCLPKGSRREKWP